MKNDWKLYKLKRLNIMNIKQILSEKVLAAMVAAGLPEDTNPAVSVSNRANFGDYQANGVMGAAKKLKNQSS